jgi:antitoxin (DNA-binding transcriptional repressor) of toxin-antitoxin stability system
MAQIRMTEAEVASNFAAVVEKLRDGAEVVVERNHRPVAVIRPPQPEARSISECIALAKEHEKQTGDSPTLDPDFAADVEEIIRQRRPWTPPPWD